MRVQDTQNLYRRLGKFLKTVHTPDLTVQDKPKFGKSTTELSTDVVKEPKDLGLEHVYILAKSSHYGHELSF